MKQEIYDKMILTPAGGVSSTRVKSWSGWVFFRWFNVLFLLGFIGMAIAAVSIITKPIPTGHIQAQLPMAFIWVYFIAWMLVDFLLLLYITAPAQLAKQLEVKEIIALANKALDKTTLSK